MPFFARRITVAGFCGAISIYGVSLSAQSSQQAQDSAAAAGYVAGIAAADARPVVSRGVAGFAGGLVLGLVAPLGISSGNSVALGISGVGVYTMVAAALSGNSSPPDSLLAHANAMGTPYRMTFMDGYSNRLKHRRRVAALMGSAAGTAAGVGTVFLIISQIGDW